MSPATKDRDFKSRLRQLEAEIGTEDLETRRRLAAELAALPAEAARQEAQLTPAKVRTGAKLDLAHAAWRAAAEEYEAADQPLRELSRQFERRRGLLERELRLTSPVAIADLRAQLNALANDSSAWGVVVETGVGARIAETLRAGRKRCDDLMLEAHDHAGLEKELEAIRESVRMTGVQL